MRRRPPTGRSRPRRPIGATGSSEPSVAGHLEHLEVTGLEATAPILESAALVTIDVQRDTLDGGPLEIPGTTAALPRMAKLVEAFRRAGLPIVHVVRLYSGDGSN